ncbi:MAG: hypothetical protein AB8B74_11230 [Crocinitomicaceae bacterium]
MKKVSIYSNLYIFIFIIILIIPFFSNLLQINIESSLEEKRELSSKPEFDFDASFTREYEQYYNDNFGLRTLFVNWNSKVKLDLFKVSPNPDVVIFGKDGFMFYNSKTDGIYESYSNKDTASIDNLEKAYRNQLNIKNSLAKKNIKYILGFFPNKHTIYSEKLPLSMRLQIQNGKSLASQLVDYFKEKKFPIVDVRNSLLMAKNQAQLYHKFDTHWNSYGAYIGYMSFFNQTFDQLKIKPYDIIDFDIGYKKLRVGDLTNMIGIKQIKSYYDNSPVLKLKNKEITFTEESNSEYSKKNIITVNENCNNTNTVLIFGDSFTEALVQYFSLHFRKVIYIRRTKILMNLVEKIQPDIVMSLSTQRYLYRLIK